MEEDLPPGFRFHPTDEELIVYYLNNKVSDFRFSPRAIADVDLNKCEPWDLPGKAKMGEKEWYFFSLRDRKYPTGLRTNRATDSGYWKTTGKDKEIFHSGAMVGMKKTLVFYMGRAPRGEKSNWVTHEYRHQTTSTYRPKKDEWVVCRVFKKSPCVKKPQPMLCQSPPPLMDSPCHTTSINNLGDMDMSILNNLMPSPSSFNSASTSDNAAANNNNSGNKKMEMNMYVSWLLSRDALQLNSCQMLNGSDISNMSSLIAQASSMIGADSKLGGYLSSSPSKVMDSALQQPFEANETIWPNY